VNRILKIVDIKKEEQGHFFAFERQVGPEIIFKQLNELVAHISSVWNWI